MPTPQIYIAFLCFAGEHVVNTQCVYIPAFSSHEAELLLRQEKFEVLSRSDVTAYILTDEGKQEALERGEPRCYTRSLAMTFSLEEYCRWIHQMTQGDSALYRRTLP